jgi:glycosyltransferase involved in cell wall biosynthesis
LRAKRELRGRDVRSYGVTWTNTPKQRVAITRYSGLGGQLRVLIIVENLPVPFDRRVWSEATTLRDAGHSVFVICPKAHGYQRSHEIIDGISIYRHPLPLEARDAGAYLIEYTAALLWEFLLSLKIWRRHGFDVIHACNPPDLIFLIGLFYKILAGKKFVFDHHDANPEVYEAKFCRRGFLWKLLRIAEKLTFKVADISIATNESYRRIAMERGGMRPERIFVVRSGPNLDRVRSLPPDPAWRKGRRFLVGYVGVISRAEGLDLLLSSVSHIVCRHGRKDIQFVVAGSGPELQAITQAAEKMKVADYVTFTGRIDDARLFTMLSTADVCVNPDRVTAMNDISTMNKIMEYMALGKPIVQFDVKEGRVSAQGASLYAEANNPLDFAEKVLELIDHPGRRIRMGEYGRKRVEEALAWHHEQPKLLHAYATLAELRGHRWKSLNRIRRLLSGSSGAWQQQL